MVSFQDPRGEQFDVQHAARLPYLRTHGDAALAQVDRRRRGNLPPQPAKAALLYDEIDRNPLFRGTVEKEDRSLMNICFVMADGYEELAPEFMEAAKARGIVGIKGHRLVGGFRRVVLQCAAG